MAHKPIMISPMAKGTWNNNPTIVLYLTPTNSTANVNGIAKTPRAPKRQDLDVSFFSYLNSYKM